MKAVVVHRGGRDHYQVAQALSEKAMLQTLVTDLYWPQHPWIRAAERALPGAVTRRLASRRVPGVADHQVRACAGSGALAQLAAMLPGVPFRVQRRLVRWTDHTLGKEAQRLAIRHNAAIVSYSYYAHAAFTDAPAHLPRILFQLHPHPASVRRILSEELRVHPACRASLLKEWELALPEPDFLRLVQETRAAHAWIVASTYTRDTMIENGTPADLIAVAPYGVDSQWFTPGRPQRDLSGPLRLLFVGTINQRKGIRYLVDALERLDSRQITLTVCGRVVDDLASLRTSRVSVDVRPNVSADHLREQYRRADAFVLPSLVEGFGHVLLEAMACGVPIITTTRTAGPDLVRAGREGFVVAPADSDALATTFEWCLTHRPQLSEMREAARSRAETFTWDAFRTQVATQVARFSQQPQSAAT